MEHISNVIMVSASKSFIQYLVAGYAGYAEEHGVKYTGVIIDNYEDDVSGDVVEQEDVQRFQYFGNMLLHQGGELGYHGYIISH